MARTGHENGVMTRQLGAACVVVTLSMSQAFAISPGDAFEKLVESKSLEECLAQPDDTCVFELTVSATKESRDDDEYLRDVARMLAREGFFDRALSAASKIDKFSHWLPWALADIAVEQARAGMVEEARQTADAVWHAGAMFPEKLVRTENPLWFIRSLCAIASAQARARDEDSKRNLTVAIAIAEQSNRSELYAIGRAWHYIIEAQVKVEGVDAARKSLESMKKADSSEWWVILALNDIAVAEASAGKQAQALETFSEAKQLARTMETRSSSRLRVIGVAQGMAGLTTQAAATLGEAVEAAKKVQASRTRIEILTNVAKSQREMGLHEDADATAKIAIEAARARVNHLLAIQPKIWEAEVKIAKALFYLSSAQIFAGRIRDAEWTVDRIRRLTEIDYFSGFYQAWAMAGLAVAQWKDGRQGDADDTIRAAEENAREFDSELARRGVGHWYSFEVHWYEVAVAKATVGDVRGALRIGEQHTGDTRFHIFQGVAELMAEG